MGWNLNKQSCAQINLISKIFSQFQFCTCKYAWFTCIFFYRPLSYPLKWKHFFVQKFDNFQRKWICNRYGAHKILYKRFVLVYKNLNFWGMRDKREEVVNHKISFNSPTIFLLKKQWSPAALEFSFCHDSDAVSKEISLIHVMCSQEDGTTLTMSLQ